MGKLAAGVAAVLSAGLAAGTACSGGGPGGQGAQPEVVPEVVVTPDESLVPPEGGANPPASATTVEILTECDRRLRAGEFRELIASMERAAERAARRGVPQAAASASVCDGTAKINIGQVDAGLAELAQVSATVQVTSPAPGGPPHESPAGSPDETTADRPTGGAPSGGSVPPARVALPEPVLELMYRAQIVGYAATGDQRRLDAAVTGLAAVDPAAAATAAAAECEKARQEGSAVRCRPPQPAGSPEGPEGSPDAPAEPEPEPTGSRSEPVAPEPSEPEPVEPRPTGPADPGPGETQPGAPGRPGDENGPPDGEEAPGGPAPGPG